MIKLVGGKKGGVESANFN